VNHAVLPTVRAPFASRFRRWSVVAALSVASVLLQLGGEAVRQWARYDPAAVGAGQWWRLITAHAVHLGWGHLSMNLAALILIGLLLEDVLEPLEWLTATIVSALAIDAGLYFFEPGVEWYVGLSGVLHGLATYGALSLIRRRSSVGAGLAIGLLAKLVWERWWGPLPFTAAHTGGPVVAAAHLYGAAGGTVAYAVAALIRRRRPAPS
jgi:rhomboid family GlyGly-CTERM serine protease